MKLFRILMYATIVTQCVYAQQHVVDMLNTLDGNIMVFNPPVIKVKPNDTVVFKSVDAGHNTESYAVPKGAVTWEGAISKSVTVKFDKPGTYVYICEPHIMMGMLGIVQVGDVKDKDIVTRSFAKLEKRVMMNKDRLAKYKGTWEQSS